MKPRFYYAGGKSVSLRPEAGQVAVDLRHVKTKTLAARVAEATRTTPPLSEKLVLAPRTVFTGEELASLEASGALRPVYRHKDVIAVPLPEVRVEVDDSAARQRVQQAISASKIPLEVVDDGEDRIVLRPTSDSGEDALDLANYIYETASPAMASPRMKQFPRRPEPGTKASR